MSNRREERRNREPNRSYFGAAFGGERNGVDYDVSGRIDSDMDLSGQLNLANENGRLGLSGHCNLNSKEWGVAGVRSTRWGDIGLTFDEWTPHLTYVPSAYAKQVAKYAVIAGLGALALYLIFR